VLVVARGDVKATIDELAAHGVAAYDIGLIIERKEGEPQTVVV
jgi:hypothetical protein